MSGAIDAMPSQAADDVAAEVARRGPGEWTVYPPRHATMRFDLAASTPKSLNGCSVATATSEQLRELVEAFGREVGSSREAITEALRRAKDAEKIANSLRVMTRAAGDARSATSNLATALRAFHEAGAVVLPSASTSRRSPCCGPTLPAPKLARPGGAPTATMWRCSSSRWRATSRAS